MHATNLGSCVVGVSEAGGLNSVSKDTIVLMSLQLECWLHVSRVDGVQVDIFSIPVTSSHGLHLSVREAFQPMWFLHSSSTAPYSILQAHKSWTRNATVDYYRCKRIA